MEDLWKEMFPFSNGPWPTMREGEVEVEYYDWKFKNLADAFKEGGILHGETVYLFRLTAAHHFHCPSSIQAPVTNIPIVVAVVSTFPPSDMIALYTGPVDSPDNEVIVPMREMKMEWARYRNRNLGSSQIFYLRCSRKVKALKEPREVMKYKLCLPFFRDPFKVSDYPPDFPIVYPSNPKPVIYHFRLGFDNVEKVTEELIAKRKLSISQRDAFRDFLMEKVEPADMAMRKAIEERRVRLEEMSEGTRAAYQNMRRYKFYPGPDPHTPNISDCFKHPSITVHYGSADRVV